MDIEWKEGAVCFAAGAQIRIKANSFSAMERLTGGGTWRPELRHVDALVKMDDFQLNTVKQGDYIESLELDTKQRYNDAVEVFALFGFALCSDDNDLEWLNRSDTYKIGVIVVSESRLMGVRAEFSACERKRKLTYPQIMAIGKLKRLELERDNALIDAVENTTILSDALNGRRSESHSEQDTVNNPSHYQFFEGVEVIEIIASSMTREQFKGYCLGNRIKYRLRAGNKDKLEQEIAKSDKYV